MTDDSKHKPFSPLKSLKTHEAFKEENKNQ